MEIVNHPVLGKLPKGNTVTIDFEGQKLQAREGQTVASALMMNGINKFGHSRNMSQARGLYCANGRCQSCLMTIDGVEHTRACSTIVRDGMTIAKNTGDPEIGRSLHGN